MTDWFHKALKAISYNRYTALGIVLGASFLVAVAGCEIKTLSPFTNEQATETEIVAQAEDYAASVALTEKEAYAAYEATVARLKLDAEQKGRDAERAVADIQSKRANINLILGTAIDIASAAGGPTGSGLVLGLGVLGSLFGAGTIVDAARRKQLIDSIVTKPPTTTPTA